jgi:hypothetical protein
MNELLRIAIDAGLFFAACTAIFLLGFIVDERLQARRSAGVRTMRTSCREGEAAKPAPAASA